VETLISILPTILSYWTGILLSWGCYVGISYVQILAHHKSDIRGSRDCDVIVAATVWTLNAILVVFLFLLPQSIITLCGDAIIVLDIWYTLFLTYCSIGIRKWLTYRHQNYNPHQTQLFQ
jgi:hypothetical protein